MEETQTGITMNIYTEQLDNCPDHYTVYLFSNSKFMELVKHRTGLSYKQWLSLD